MACATLHDVLIVMRLVGLCRRLHLAAMLGRFMSPKDDFLMRPHGPQTLKTPGLVRGFLDGL